MRPLPFRTPEERLDALLATAPDGIMIADADGKMVLINDQVERMVGYRRDELLGQTVELLVPERFRATHVGQRRAFMADPHMRPMGAGRDLSVLTRDSRELPVEISLSPLQTEDGLLIVSIIRDVSERRRLEAELKQRNDELTDTDRRKDEFLAVLSHELRNPLAPIQSAVEVLRTTESKEPDVHWARDVINRQVDQMARLIEDLLDVSRINQGKIRLHRERVPLSAMVASAVETVRPLVEGRGHVLDIQLPPDDVELVCDPIRVAQVIANLLNNAAKYTDECGRIRVTARVDGREVELRVKDTGIGIPREFLPRIFETFSQADRSLERARGGLGIGLTLVKTLVELHGGHVVATSEGPGKGAEFIVRLPTAGGPAAPSSRAEEPSKPEGAPRRRVLVADDNVDFAESVARLLKRRGFEVTVVHTGAQAIEKARALSPEIALLDIGLPGISGYDVATELRSVPGLSDLLLVAVSGYGREEDRSRSRESGFDEHLTKPIQIEALLEVLRRPRRGSTT